MVTVRKCYIDFKEAVKGLMSEKDAQALFDEAEAAAMKRWQDRLEPKSEALNKTFEELMQEREFKLKRARIQTLKNVVKYHKALNDIGQFKSKTRGVLALLGGIEANIPGSRASVVAEIHSQMMNIKSNFLRELEKNNLQKVFESKHIDDDLASEIEEPNTSQNPQIRDLAKIIKKHQGRVVKLLNNEGATIKETEGYIAKLKHNAGRMKSATGFGLKDAKLRTKLFLKHKGDWRAANEEFKEMSFQRWKNRVDPLTDDTTFERIEDRDKFFRSFYNSVTTGVHKVPVAENTSMAAGGSPLLVRVGGNIANKLSEARILKFKKGGWVKYNQDYGYDTIHDAVVRQFEESGKALGVMKKLGTSPRNMGMRLIRQAQEWGEERQEPGFKKNITRARNLLDTILGDIDQPMQGLSGQIFRSFRMVQYLSKTGGITLSSIPDLGIMTSALRQQGYSPIEVYNTALTNLVRGLPKGQLKELALQLRIYSDGTLGSLMSKFGSTDTLYGNFAKMMRVQDKLTLINRWDNTTRYTMGFMLSKKLASVIDKDFDNILASQRRTLEISGIDEKAWRTLQANRDKFTTVQNMKFITPEVAQELSDESVANIMLGKDVEKATPLQLQRARQKIEDALGVFFTDQTAYGKVLPNASDRALMNGGVRANTFAGQIWRMLTMFHSFHVAATRRTLGRFLYGNGAEDLYDALIRGKADFKGMGQYMLQSLPLGYISYASKLMAKGLMPPSLNDKKTWEESAVRGGMFFVYGSYFADAFNSQHDFLSSVAGPGIKTVSDAIGIMRKIIDGKNPANSAVWLAQNNIPFMNLFYLKHVLDHTILNGIHQKMDPTYIYKLQQRAAKNNQHYLWLPPT